MDGDDFVCVVGWARPGEADRAWRDWKDAHPRTASALDLRHDVIVDVGRTNHGDEKRYSVRAVALLTEDA